MKQLALATVFKSVALEYIRECHRMSKGELFLGWMGIQNCTQKLHCIQQLWNAAAGARFVCQATPVMAGRLTFNKGRRKSQEN